MIQFRIFTAALLGLASFASLQAQQGGQTPNCTQPGAALLQIVRPATDAATPNCPTLVGTWQVTVTPDGGPSFQAVNVFLADGNSIEFDNSNPPAGQTIAAGPWQKTGPAAYSMLEINQIFDNQGNFAGTVQVTATINLDDSGNGYSSKFQFTVADPDGNTIVQGTGSATGKRVMLSPPQ